MLCAGANPTTIACTLGVSKPMVCDVKRCLEAGDSLNRKPGTCGNVILQQDGATAHTSNVTQQFLQNNILFFLAKNLVATLQSWLQSYGLYILAACWEAGMQHPSCECYSPEGLNQPGMECHGHQHNLQGVHGLQAQVRGSNCCWWRLHQWLTLNKGHVKANRKL